MRERLLILLVSFLLSACLGCGSGHAGRASFVGQVHGQTFSPADAVSYTPAEGGAVAVVYVGSTGGLCDDFAHQRTRSSAFSLSIELVDWDLAAHTASAPSAPGDYAVIFPPPNVPREAGVFFHQTDATCAFTENSETGVAGTVSLTAVRDGALTGTYDITFHSGDRVTGSFDAAACPQIGSWPAEALSCL